MKKLFPYVFIFSLIGLVSCSEDGLSSESGFLTDSSSGASSDSAPQGSGQGEAGKITAGEWNDLDHWDFWNSLLNKEEFAELPDYWQLYTNNRFSIQLQDKGNPVIDAQVELLKGAEVIWTARTDNMGSTELWADHNRKAIPVNPNDYQLRINGVVIQEAPVRYSGSPQVIEWEPSTSIPSNVEVSFIVDATGSMGDELEFLKEDLKSVLQKIVQDDPDLRLSTSTVFYRDLGDEYVVRKSGFTSNLNATIDFINAQSANGGGDYPEAVHTALETAIEELQWSMQARTRIAFLILDAPPHYDPQVLSSLQKQIKQAAAKGIKIIPITASGINKSTESLTRLMGIYTNGTYVFITNDSGIGNDHLEASVGDYEVELLNELMIRLLKKYTN